MNQNNPYELLYKAINQRPSEKYSKNSVEEITKQITYLHTTLGIAMEDFIKLTAKKFDKNDGQNEERNLKNNEDGIIDLEGDRKEEKRKNALQRVDKNDL